MNEQQFQKVKILLDIGMNNQTQLDLDRVLKNYVQYRYEDPLKIHPTSYHPKLLSPNFFLDFEQPAACWKSCFPAYFSIYMFKNIW